MTVNPTPQSPTQSTNVIETAQAMPRWALMLIVGGAGLLTWWIIKDYKSGTTDSWTDRATALLTSRGYTHAQISIALNHYFQGGMTTQDQEIIAEAIRALGTPDLPNITTGVHPSSPVNPTGTYNSTTPITTTNGGYWYVVSMGVGWSSSFRGLAQQFYGDANKGTIIQQANPGITSADYQRIPVGTSIKIPRSVA